MTGDLDNAYINKLDLLSQTFTSAYLTIPVSYLINNPNGARLACLTGDHQYLYYVGGGAFDNQFTYFNYLSIYALAGDIWNIGPTMNTKRGWFSCNVSPNNRLYAIAGSNSNDDNYLNSIEYISTTSISNNQWSFITNLSQPLAQQTSATYGDFIFVIGGLLNGTVCSNKVHIINTITDHVSVSSDRLLYDVCSPSSISVNQLIYSFGGYYLKTFNSWQYLIMPTSHPTEISMTSTVLLHTNTTVEPIRSTDANQLSSETEIILKIVVLLLILILLIIIGLFVYNRNRRKLRKKAKTIYIQNPMVIIVSIGVYEEHPKDPDIDAYFANLDNIEIDIENVIKLFGKQGLNYDIFPEYGNDISSYKIKWTEQELINFLKTQSNKLELNLNKAKKHLYDGLFVVISCHGMEGYIISSDIKRLSKMAIHRIFSATKPQSRKIPRIFLFDSCSGNAEKSSQPRIRSGTHGKTTVVSDEKAHVGKNTEIHDIVPSNSLMWAENEDNPDFKLVIINSSNHGFQSKMRVDTGSYVITKLTQQLGENIMHNNNKQFLNEILDDIQEVLHDKGKQLMVKIFNNKTEYIKFKINKDTTKQSNNVEMQ
eukprot:368502_1